MPTPMTAGLVVEVTTPYAHVCGTPYDPATGMRSGHAVLVSRGKRGTVADVYYYPHLDYTEADVQIDGTVLRMQVDSGDRPGPGGVSVSADQSDPRTIRFNCAPA